MNTNIEHNNNFQAVYEILLDEAIKENKQMQGDLGYALNNFDKVYNDVPPFSFDGNRDITIRWVRFPTVSEKNRPRYYTVFLCNLPWFNKDDYVKVGKLCAKMLSYKIQHPGMGYEKDNDSKTIFLCGRQRGYITGKDFSLLRKLNMFVFSIKSGIHQIRSTIFRVLSTFIERRCARFKEAVESHTYIHRWGMTSNRRRLRIYGGLKHDYQRLMGLSSLFHSMRRDCLRLLANLRNQRLNCP